MKKNFDFLITILISTVSLCNAQNFKTIYPGNTAHFSYFISNNQSKAFYNTISIDSMLSTISGNELYNFLSFDISAMGICFTANRSTWIGTSIFQDNNGTEYFLNTDTDTVVIQSQAVVGSDWHLYNYSNGNYIETMVTSIDPQNFLGLTDSVKTIQLTVKNSAGNVVANSLNGKQIKISRNYGFVQTFGFKNFPSDTTIFTLAGLSSPQVGIVNLTADSIFNFNVGDEFHHYSEQSCFSVAIHDYYYSIQKILSKSFSLNHDTVFYLTERCNREEHYNFSNFYYTTSFDTVTVSYLLSPDALFDKYSFQLGADPSWFQGYLEFYSDTTHNSRLKKLTHYYYIYDSFSNCFELPIGLGIFPNNVYSSGLGLIYSTDDGCPISTYFDSLVYYKKGNEVWGQPLNCATLLSINDNFHQKEIVLFPNPVADYLNLNMEGISSSKQFHITIKNVMNQSVLERDLIATNNMSIPVNDLISGIYFLIIASKEKEFKTLKFCKL